MKLKFILILTALPLFLYNNIIAQTTIETKAPAKISIQHPQKSKKTKKKNQYDTNACQVLINSTPLADSSTAITVDVNADTIDIIIYRNNLLLSQVIKTNPLPIIITVNKKDSIGIKVNKKKNNTIERYNYTINISGMDNSDLEIPLHYWDKNITISITERPKKVIIPPAPQKQTKQTNQPDTVITIINKNLVAHYDTGGHEKDSTVRTRTYTRIVQLPDKSDSSKTDSTKTSKNTPQKSMPAGMNNDTIGAQQGLLAVSLFQSFPNFADDDPKGLLQYHVDIIVPINHTKGIPNKLHHEWFRNIHISGDESFLKNFGAGVYTDSISPLNKPRYVNDLDLFQYANGMGTLEPNIYTLFAKNQDFTIYINGLASIVRTAIYSNTDSLFTVNSGLFGFDFKAVTSFPLYASKLDVLFDGQIFWINLLSNAVNSGLNSQDSKIQYNTGKGLSYSSPQDYPYGGINVTLRYAISQNSTTNSGKPTTTTITTAESAQSQSYIYVKFAFYTNFVLGNEPALYSNNFMQLQIGYSIPFSSVLQALQKLIPSSNNSGSSSPQ